uniref:Uncharacterized protein n=1 Tax=Anopheles dirus TaxID=7168 RepID=A0A182MY41_9DIPT
MADQGQSPPITSAPKRSSDHPAALGMPLSHPHLHGSESCKSSPNVPRRHDPHHSSHLPHHAAALLLLESGSQSAKSSPLPNRRLDKLQGVIRDQRSTPLTGRRAHEADVLVESFDSPLVSRRFLALQQQPCECGQGAPPSAKRRATSECMCGPGSEQQPMRKRVDSDCGSGTCLRKNVVRHNFGLAAGGGGGAGGVSSCENSPVPVRRPFGVPGSPAKSVLGEPGVFSSPIHRPYGGHHHHGAFHGLPASPAKSVLGEPGVFSSPARSVVCSPPGEPRGGETAEESDAGGGASGGGGPASDVLAGDQTIVSGWLKFRDNKKVSVSSMKRNERTS